MLKSIFSAIIEITLVSSVIIANLAVLYAFIDKRYAAKWRCFIWVAIMVRLLVPINLTMPSAPIVVPEPQRQEITMNQPVEQAPIAPTMQQPNEQSTTVAPTNQPSTYNITTKPVKENTTLTPTKPVTIWLDKVMIASYIWLIGMLVATCIYIVRRVRFQRYIKRNGIEITQKRILSMLIQVCNQQKIQKAITPFLCKGLSSPMVVGLINPRLLLPMMNYSDQELTAILRHEMVHIHKHHLWLKFGLLLCEIVHWFNPFVYLMTKFANRDIELACDSTVLKQTSESYKTEYSKAILTVIENTMNNNSRIKPVLATGFSDGKKTLMGRFQNIYNTNKKKKGFIALMAIILVIVIAGSFLVFGKREVKQVNDSLTIYKLVGKYSDEQLSTGPAYNITSMVKDYEKKYPNIKVNLVKFTCSAEEFIAKMSTELLAGKGPDVVVIDNDFSNEKDVYKLMKSGVFVELDDFIKNDDKMNLDDYYKPIMDQGVYKNRRYILPVQFATAMLFSGEKALQDAGINAENCKKDYWGLSNEMYQYYSQDQTNKNLIQSGLSRYDMLNRIEYMGIRGAFDFNKGEIKFDTKEFQKAMEQHKPWYQFDKNAEKLEYAPVGKQIRDQKVLLDSSIDFYPTRVFYYIQTLQNYDKSVLIPIRTMDGGMEATITTAVAIQNNSRNKQNAYNYIKLMLSPTHVGDYYLQGFPTNKKQAEACVKYTHTDALNGYYDQQYDMRYSHVPKQYDEEMISFLNQIDGAHFYTPLSKQLAICMMPYLDDEKSYEDCIKEAKEKFELYLTE